MIDQQQYDTLCGEFFPVFRKLCASEEYAITLGGSHGKGLSDKNSDFDFRIYCLELVSWSEMKEILKDVDRLVKKWNQMGIRVDGVWPRKASDVDRQLNEWLAGEAAPVHMHWNVWGYHILTDVYNQLIVEDPFGIAQMWKERLKNYPASLEQAILHRCGSSILYWRGDYHYRNKVNRKDSVFLASITSRLINDIMQALYALNHFYFPGDGMNLVYTEQFAVKPTDFESRVMRALYPNASNPDDAYSLQYQTMIELIDDTLALIPGDIKLEKLR